MGFTEIREGSGKKIALSVILLIVAIGYTFYNMGGGASKSRLKHVFKCEDCGHVVELSRDEFIEATDKQNRKYIEMVEKENPEQAKLMREMIENPGGMMPGMMDRGMPGMMLPSWGYNSPMDCPKCGAQKLWSAIKCPNPKGCDNVFYRNPKNKFPDECPVCKYSKSRERQKERAKKKEEEKEEKSRKNRLKKQQKEKEK